MGHSYKTARSNRGQSFVELAIVLPILLFLLIAFVEVGAIIYHYLSMLDVAREAARFASEHDYEVLNAPGAGLPMSACTDSDMHYYYDTACVIIGAGFNPDLTLNPATDDVTISVFTVDDNVVSHRWPDDGDGVWSLYGENWTRNCDGSLRSTTPFMTNAELASYYAYSLPTFTAPPNSPTPGGPGLPVNAAQPDKGIVMVEVYYCHEQLLNLPLIADLLPNPIPLHAYAVMPAPSAEPTPTPRP
jgi:hypothetical protein